MNWSCSLTLSNNTMGLKLIYLISMPSEESGDEIVEKFNLQSTNYNDEGEDENNSPDCISLRD